MKYLLFLSLLFPSVSCSLPVPNTAVIKPLRLEEHIERSIVRLTLTDKYTMGSYICTGFSIAPRKFLTAAHCVIPPEDVLLLSPELRADGFKAAPIAIDETTDLAVVLVDVVKPPLQLRDIPLSRFEIVHAAGFGEGFIRPLFTDQRVMLLNYTLRRDIFPGTVFLYPFIGGMSGGPIYDDDGNVVGIVQRSGDETGYGVSGETIQKFLSLASGV